MWHKLEIHVYLKYWLKRWYSQQYLEVFIYLISYPIWLLTMRYCFQYIGGHTLLFQQVIGQIQDSY